MFNTFSKTGFSYLDLPVLAEMPAKLTLEYSESSRNDGISSHASILTQYITNIQQAIDSKRSAV